MKQQNFFGIREAESVNIDIDNLYIAEEEDIFRSSGIKAEGYKAISVNKEIIHIARKSYKLVQHAEAFRPIVEGLTVSSVPDFRYYMYASRRRAYFNVLVGTADEGIQFGFKCVNSFDGSTAIRYGFKAANVTKYIEVVGYRQICSNGMIIRVPLDRADFIRKEERQKIEELLRHKLSIRHTKSAEEKLKMAQYTVEVFVLLQAPLTRMINAGKMQKIEDKKKALEIIKIYVGKRLSSRIMKQYDKEEETLWGLYNAVTYVASHDNISLNSRLRLENNSANMLTEMLEN